MISRQRVSASQLIKEAKILEKSEDFLGAFDKYKEVLANFPGNKKAQLKLSQLKKVSNTFENKNDEIVLFEDALKRGDKTAVKFIAKEMISKKTYNSFVLLHYARVIEEAEVGKLYKIIGTELNKPNLSRHNRHNFLMARYSLEKKKKKFHLAFDTLELANLIRYSKVSFKPDRDEESVKRLKFLFNRIDINKTKLRSKPSEKKLIFIVGMPRSGSTLLEQILCRHDQITSIGEKPFVTKFLSTANWQDHKNLNEILHNLKSVYQKNLKLEKVSTNFIIDKMPFNLFWVGFLALAYPDAKFFYSKRDARATCWSNYETAFAEGNSYSHRLEDIVDHYNRCTRLMQFWIDLFPSQIYTFDYEKFVSSPTIYGPGLFNFLNLEWSPFYLEVSRSTTEVTTASQFQVKEKIYSGSSDQWKNFILRIGTRFSNLIE